MQADAPRRVSLLYATFFALVGGSSPFLAVCLAARGFDIERIGLLMALPQALRIVAPPFWGWLADSGFGRLKVLRLSAPLIGLSLILLGLGGADFATVAAAMLLMAFAMAAQTPVVESIAIAIAAGDAGRYGRMRVWGSVGFIVAVIALGPLLDRFGAATLPWWLAGLSVFLVVACQRASVLAEPARRGDGEHPAPIRRRLREPAIAGFLVSSFCMVFAHAALYAFFSLYLQQHGYSAAAIGALWALGVIAEIVLFWFQRPLFERLGASRLLAASLLVAGARFAGVAGSDGALAWIVLTQLLHAVTFGVHHSACMALMQRWFPPAQQARAQAVFATVAYGLGGSVGAWVAGWVWVNGSPAAMFGVSAAVALAGWAAVALGRRLDYARGS